MKALLGCLVAVAMLGASNALACGACVEDKIAATYDHSVIERAVAKGDIVVFCELKGTVETARLKSAARRMKGVDATSVRIARQPPALSFALDGALHSPEDAVAALQRATPQTQITIIRLITSSTTSARDGQDSVGAPPPVIAER